MDTPDLKKAWNTSLDTTTTFVKKNGVLTGAIAGGAIGTVLFPIPVIGTLLGVWVGIKIAEKMNEEKSDN
jgi:phage tail tape-measure protein